MMNHHSNMMMNPCSSSNNINNCMPLPRTLGYEHGSLKQSFINIPNNNINCSQQKQKQKQPAISPLVLRGQPPIHHGSREGGIVPMIPKRAHWTDDERSLLAEGLKKHGNCKGKWEKISQDFLPWRTTIQIASYAQRHFRNNKKRKIIPLPPLPPDWDLIPWDVAANQQQQQVLQQPDCGLHIPWEQQQHRKVLQQPDRGLNIQQQQGLQQPDKGPNIPWEQQQGLQQPDRGLNIPWEKQHQQEEEQVVQPLTGLNPLTSNNFLPSQQQMDDGWGISDSNTEEYSQQLMMMNNNYYNSSLLPPPPPPPPVQKSELEDEDIQFSLLLNDLPKDN